MPKKKLEPWFRAGWRSYEWDQKYAAWLAGESLRLPQPRAPQHRTGAVLSLSAFLIRLFGHQPRFMKIAMPTVLYRFVAWCAVFQHDNLPFHYIYILLKLPSDISWSRHHSASLQLRRNGLQHHSEVVYLKKPHARLSHLLLCRRRIWEF